MSLSRLLSRLAGRQRVADAERPTGFIYDVVPGIVYAMGDIHGCLAELLEKDRAIQEDCHRHGQQALIIHLGDHIDRGPDSAAVLDYLMVPPPVPIRRVCLMGNHEAMFLDFLAAPEPDHPFLDHGGRETLRSYGLAHIPKDAAGLDRLLKSAIPRPHVVFLKDMPLFAKMPGLVCVHAGLDPDALLSAQTTQTMLWRRAEDNDVRPPVHGHVVIHGHTPVTDVVCSPYRYNVDTGAFKTGILSVVRRDLDGNIRVF